MTGDGIGWWFLAVGVVLAVIPFVIVKRERWWPGAWGWAICFFAIGVGVADNFRSWMGFVLAALLVGLTLGFAGVLNGPNSPAK